MHDKFRQNYVGYISFMFDIFYIGPFYKKKLHKLNYFMLYYVWIFLFFWFSPPVESGSRVSSGIEWFQPPPDCNCGRSNRGLPYQIQFLSFKFLYHLLKRKSSCIIVIYVRFREVVIYVPQL
jgi:hypothetical protein